MPSINMKLEMVTIIACEVDTEVFTSDKMQVRFSPERKQCLCGVVGQRLASGPTACRPVEVRACLGDVECRIFINGSRQLAKTRVQCRALGEVIDGG